MGSLDKLRFAINTGEFSEARMMHLALNCAETCLRSLTEYMSFATYYELEEAVRKARYTKIEVESVLEILDMLANRLHRYGDYYARRAILSIYSAIEAYRASGGGDGRVKAYTITAAEYASELFAHEVRAGIEEMCRGNY